AAAALPRRLRQRPGLLAFGLAAAAVGPRRPADVAGLLQHPPLPDLALRRGPRLRPSRRRAVGADAGAAGGDEARRDQQPARPALGLYPRRLRLDRPAGRLNRHGGPAWLLPIEIVQFRYAFNPP